METTGVQRVTYTVEEVAELLGLSRGSAYLAVATGEIPSIRIGKRILIPQRALEQVLQCKAIKAAENWN